MWRYLWLNILKKKKSNLLRSLKIVDQVSQAGLGRMDYLLQQSQAG